VFSLALFAVAVYVAVNVGEVWLRYYQLLDEMRVQVRLAPNLPDATIRDRLLRRVEQLGLPDEARRFSIRRTSRPREIVISTEYRETVTLPFFTHTFTFRPRASAPL
jgi:hypothetical protein